MNSFPTWVILWSSGFDALEEAFQPPADGVRRLVLDGLPHGWAVVEFNPAWCSGLLGADPAAVLGVLERACRDVDGLDAADAAWVVARGGT